jgi:autotransporter translocation and assembly factor TamB
VVQSRVRVEGKLVHADAFAGSDARVELDALRVGGRAAAGAGSIAGAIERASLRVAIARDQLAITGPLALRAGLGALDVAVEWPRAEGAPVQAQLTPHGVRVAELSRQLGWQAPWLDAQLDGRAALRGTLAPLAVSGTLHAELRAVRVGKAGEGDAIWSAEHAGLDADVQLDAAGLSLSNARLALGPSHLQGSARAGLDGAFTASLRGDALGQLDAEARVEQGGGLLRFTRAEIAGAERKVAAEGLVVDLRGAPSFKARLRIARLPLAELYRALGAAGDPALSRLQAIAEGSADLSFARGVRGDALALALQLQLRDASFDGYRFERGALNARVDLPDVREGLAAGTLAIERLALAAGAGAFELRGDMQRGALKMALSFDGLPIERAPWFAQHAPLLSGRAAGKGELLGSAADPRLSLALALDDLSAGGASLGGVKLDARLSREAASCSGQAQLAPAGASRWTLCGQGLSGRARLALALDAVPGHAVRGRVDVDRMPLDAFLPERADGKRVRGLLTAGLEIGAGSADALDQLSFALSVQRLELGEGEGLLVNDAPFVLRAQRGALSLSGARLSAPKLEFALAASGALGAGAKLTADGKVQASLWSGIHALVSPLGDVRVHAERELGGRGRTRVELSPQDVVVLIGEAPLVQKLHGTLVVEDGRGTLRGVGARLGGGDVALGGEVGVRGVALDRYDLSLAAKGVTVQPQDHVEMTVDADARLRSSQSGPPTLSGLLRVKRLLYTRHIEFPAALMGTNKKEREDRAGYDRARDRLLLDLTLVHDEPLRVRNNLLDAEFVFGGADHALKLSGSDQRMGLRGKVELKRGRVMFHGDEFQLTRGEIGFDEATRIDPNFDVRAVADARKKNDKASIVFSAHGNRDAFEVLVRCDAKVGPAPFTCDYAHDRLRCDDF